MRTPRRNSVLTRQDSREFQIDREGTKAAMNIPPPSMRRSSRSNSVCSVESRRSSLARLASKVKMGKKVEKGLKEKNLSATSQDETDSNRVLEPHICTGNFQSDFNELCRRAEMTFVPPIVMRPRPIGTVPPAEVSPVKGGKDKGKQAQPEPEPEVELTDDGEPVDAPPKTYTTKDKFEYFKPCIQVEMDNPDKQDTVTEVFIRGWKIDSPMMEIFKQCWRSMEKLHSINLWSTGLTEDTIHILASFLPNCINLRNLTLDGNANSAENWYELLVDESPIQNLSLRHCALTDMSATMIGRCLGSTKRSNMKLLSLNLSNNKITDDGLDHIAQGLRMNRTLLSLSLANNQIGDKGVIKLGEVLSRFPLSHEEVVERRRQKSDRSSPDRNKSPALSRRADSKDRPGSVRSATHADKDKNKKEKPSAKKKDQKGKDEKEEKHDKGKGKKEKEDKSGGKKDSKHSQASDNRSRASNVGGRSSGASIAADAGKGTKGGKGGKGGKDKGKPTQPDHETSDSPDIINPLQEGTDFIDGQLWVSGNRVLLNINLSRNKIGEAGMSALLKAVQYQTTIAMESKNSGTGLMRVVIGKNKISPDHEVVKKLVDIMVPKDPFYKPPPQTPDLHET